MRLKMDLNLPLKIALAVLLTAATAQAEFRHVVMSVYGMD